MEQVRFIKRLPDNSEEFYKKVEEVLGFKMKPFSLTYNQVYYIVKKSSFLIDFVWLYDDFGELHSFQESWFEYVRENENKL
jgi:hypothetical protein